MKLTTTICVDFKETPKTVSLKARRLKDAILAFAKIPGGHAFWDAESAKAENCILVYGSYVAPEDAAYIKCDDIDKELAAWCQEVADCLHETPDEGEECGWFDVEVEDLGWGGGMHITCCRKGDKPLYVLWVLPARKADRQEVAK